MIDSLVSIIIPTYNRPDYLQRAIESSLKQTHKNIEVIVIDDHSDYDVSQVIDKFHDTRVKLFTNEINQGSVRSRNRGLDLSSGSYINFLDDDDVLMPEKIEFQLNKFLESQIQNLGVVTCDMVYQRQDINEVKKNHFRGDIYKKLLSQYCIYGIHSMLIKRKYCPKFDPNLTSNQEYDLAIRVAKFCAFDFVPKTLAITYESENQISFNYEKKKLGTKYLFNKYRTEFLRFGISFYMYNWFRFLYLRFKYFVALKLGNTQINKVIYTLHNRLLKSNE